MRWRKNRFPNHFCLSIDPISDYSHAGHVFSPVNPLENKQVIMNSGAEVSTGKSMVLFKSKVSAELGLKSAIFSRQQCKSTISLYLHQIIFVFTM